MEPKFLYHVAGLDYLVGYDLEEALASYRLAEIGMVFLVEGRAYHQVKDLLNAHDGGRSLRSPLKLLPKRYFHRPLIKKRGCCHLQPGERIVGEIAEDGSLAVHLFDCEKARRYWW